MTVYALLLRGVNVGGHGLLRMATLRELLSALGYDGIRTYLQSGNAVVATPAAATRVAADVQQVLAAALGREVAVMVRSAAELRGILEGWPFDPEAAAATKHVTFLPSAAAAGPVAGLDAERYLPERLRVVGRELYLFAPAGLGRSVLAPVLARRLGAVGTTRNWNTVSALTDLTARLGR